MKQNFETRWIGWAGVSVPDKDKDSLKDALALKVGWLVLFCFASLRFFLFFLIFFYIVLKLHQVFSLVVERERFSNWDLFEFLSSTVEGESKFDSISVSLDHWSVYLLVD